MSDPAPLILTIAVGEADQARFDRLRTQHFPPERNHLAAHVTLFHHLPGAKLGPIRAVLADAALALTPFPIAVTGLRSLGRGVAFSLDSAALTRLRADLAARWWDGLTAQDRQGFPPHITIQNKVGPDQARALLTALAAGFTPFDIEATGLLLWRYRGGPWSLQDRFDFPSRSISSRSACCWSGPAGR